MGWTMEDDENDEIRGGRLEKVWEWNLWIARAKSFFAGFDILMHQGGRAGKWTTVCLGFRKMNGKRNTSVEVLFSKP